MSGNGVVELAVVIYRPLEGNYHHWGFHLYSRRTQTHRIFQTEGLPNNLAPRVVAANPVSSARLLKRILLGGIYENQVTRLVEIIRGVEMQNDVASWDCQEYVIDIMDELEDAGLLGSRPKYNAIKSAVKDMRGTVESTTRAVVNYDYNRLRDEESDEGESDEDEEEPEDDDDDEQPTNVQSAERVEDSDEE